MIVRRNEFVTGKEANGKRFKFLDVKSVVDHESWEADVGEGAVQFEDCRIAVSDNVGKYIIIEAENEEEGYLAVSYLYGMLREKEAGTHGESPEEEDFCEDYYEDERRYEEDDFICSETDYYLDDDNYLPVIDNDELINECATKNGYDSLPFENVKYSISPREYTKPYWMDLRNKSVCIVKDDSGCMPFSAYFDPEHVKLFEKSRNVFILFIRGDMNSGSFMYGNPFAVGTEVDPEDEGITRSPEITKAMLMLTADYVRVYCSEEQRNAYRVRLFSSWLKEYKLKLENEDELELITEKLSKINTDYPSETMEKSLKLLKHNNPEAEVVSLKALNKLGILSINKAPVDDVSFDDLVGLEQVKDELIRVTHLMKFVKRRKLAGSKVSDYHNVFLFLGAPGTAKTTAAKALGALMRKEGLIPRGKFISVSGSQLKAGYVGHTVDKVRNLFKENDIILIDEAYSIAASHNGEMDTFSQEALAQLAIELEEHADDKVVIFAGYGGKYVTKQDNKMEEFLVANPGIKSRISFEVSFPSYNADDMVRVVHHIAGGRGYRMVHTADDLIRNYFEMRLKDSAFGNGREARVLVENMERHIAERYYKSAVIPAGNLLITKRDIVLTLEETRKSNDHSKDRSRVFGF